MEISASRLLFLPAASLLGPIFNPEDEGDTFLPKWRLAFNGLS
jgi:hypothetical protein